MAFTPNVHSNTQTNRTPLKQGFSQCLSTYRFQSERAPILWVSWSRDLPSSTTIIANRLSRTLPPEMRIQSVDIQPQTSLRASVLHEADRENVFQRYTTDGKDVLMDAPQED